MAKKKKGKGTTSTIQCESCRNQVQDFIALLTGIEPDTNKFLCVLCYDADLSKKQSERKHIGVMR